MRAHIPARLSASRPQASAIERILRLAVLIWFAPTSRARVLQEAPTDPCLAPFVLPSPPTSYPQVSSDEPYAHPGGGATRLTVQMDGPWSDEDQERPGAEDHQGSGEGWHPHQHRHSMHHGNGTGSICAPPGLKGRRAWVEGTTAYPQKNLRMLTRRQCRRGLTTSGAGGVFDGFVRKVMRGDAVSIVFLGGSITEGTGARSWDLGWAWQFCDWVKAAFPHPDHKCQNKAIGGTPSSYMELCLQWHFNVGEADLVLLEYAVNDGMLWQMNNWEAWSMERLMRKLLKAPDPPALALVNFFPFACKTAGNCRGAGEGNREHVDKGGFGVMDAQLAELADYYNVPSVSMRSAVAEAAAAEVEGFLMPPLKCMYEPCDSDEPFKERYFMVNDRMHPNPRGHRMMAQLLVHLIQQAVVEQVLYAPPPPSTTPRLALPHPYLKDNYETTNMACYHGSSIEQIVRENSGWELKDEAPLHPDSRWGMLSSTPGSSLTIQINTTGVHGHKGDQVELRPVLTLGILRSYEGFGVARVECGGCECEGITHNTKPPNYLGNIKAKSFDPGSPASSAVAGDEADKGLELDGIWRNPNTQVDAFGIRVTQSPECNIRMTSIAAPNRTAYKLKLMSVMMATEASATAQNGVRLGAEG